MASIISEVEGLPKNGFLFFFYIQRDLFTQLTLFASIPLLCRSSASSSDYDLIFSSRDTWKRLPSVCSLDVLQSVWVVIRGSLLHTNGTIRQTPQPFIIP